jgi:CHAT domain-containing protein
MSSRYSQKRIHRLLGILFLSSLILCLSVGQVVSDAQTVNPSQLVQQGVERYQAGEYRGAIELWQTALNAYSSTSNKANEAIVSENLARGYQQVGEIDKAITYWQKASQIYRQLADLKQVGRIMTEQAQSYSRQGQHRQAIALLCGRETDTCMDESAMGIAQQQGDRLGEAAALGSLGEAYRLQGNFDRAIAYLETSLTIAQKNTYPDLTVSANNSLGNAYTSLAQVSYRRAQSADQRGDNIGEDSMAAQLRKKALDEEKQALSYFQESFKLALQQDDRPAMMRSLLNSIPLDYRRGAELEAKTKLQQAIELLPTLPEQQDKVYATIDLTSLLQPEITSPKECLKPESQLEALFLLQQAVSLSQRLENRRAESFALGKLAHVYECANNYQQALKLTQQARWSAEQDLKAKDSLYLWEWQTGRIFKALGQPKEAIDAYTRSISTLEAIRGDLLSANKDLQFDFRDIVEPIYRELIELKLDAVPPSVLLADAPNNTLSSVLGVADSLKLAELQNYFGSDCTLRVISQERVDLVSANSATAVFNSIILPDRTAIIASFPDGSKKVTWLDRDRESLREETLEFRRGLERWFDSQYDPQPAQKLYNSLIRPFAEDLEKAEIKTLIFIQDGILRSVPMAALHDGEKFLIERYAIATTPSLTLTDPKSLNRKQLRALALGLSESANVGDRVYKPLVKVNEEISDIEQQLKGSKPLLNRDFTRDRLQQELNINVYPIIHIATHGEFGAEPEDTFLVTGNNDKLTLNQLDSIIRNIPKQTQIIELLALTACKSAIGDERAALGLAGVALQAGARTALASLWSINDSATPQLVEQFYAGLQDSALNKAQALQQAQIALIRSREYAHPAYWSPFILIGNWL